MATESKIVSDPGNTGKEPILNPELAERMNQRSGALWGIGTFGALVAVELRTTLMMFQNSKITPEFLNYLIPSILPFIVIFGAIAVVIAIIGAWYYFRETIKIFFLFVVLAVPGLMGTMIVSLLFSYWFREALINSCFDTYSTRASCSEIPLELSWFLGIVLNIVLLVANGVIIGLFIEAANEESSSITPYAPKATAPPPPVLDNIMD